MFMSTGPGRSDHIHLRVPDLKSGLGCSRLQAAVTSRPVRVQAALGTIGRALQATADCTLSAKQPMPKVNPLSRRQRPCLSQLRRPLPASLSFSHPRLRTPSRPLRTWKLPFCLTRPANVNASHVSSSPCLSFTSRGCWVCVLPPRYFLAFRFCIMSLLTPFFCCSRR